MSVFLTKMQPATYAAMSPDYVFEIPNLRRRTEFRDATPEPLPGDTLVIWVNQRGLVSEARFLSISDAVRPVVQLSMYMEYPDPILPDAWLFDSKGHAGEPPASLAQTLGRSRTESGGTILLSVAEVAELDDARRNWVSN